MASVVLDMNLSLDGFVAGPQNRDARLHEWMFAPPTTIAPQDRRIMEESIAETGAILMGRRMYELGAGQNGFVDNPYRVPHFVLTSAPPAEQAPGDTEFIFVTEGAASALEQAKAAAGTRTVVIAGGATTAQQMLRGGHVEMLHLHIVPVLLGGGLRLFEDFTDNYIELEQGRVVSDSGMLHIRYRVTR